MTKNNTVENEHGVLTPKEIVSELDKYIVGQDNAKRSCSRGP